MTEPPRDRGKVLAEKYELIDVAGEGGMATVWRARTRGAAGFARTVAVKRILEGLSDNPEFVAMFVEEARVVADLSHPNVVQIHDFDADDEGNYFLVSEWVEGLTLSAWCIAHESVGWKTPWPLLCGVGIEVLKGLGAAHERRDEEGRPAPVFHRDVTPHNVLLGLNGIVKLTDFGLASAMDRAPPAGSSSTPRRRSTSSCRCGRPTCRTSARSGPTSRSRS
jgi:serine/threonine-protein kinase